MALTGLADLQASPQDQLQGVRVPHLPRLRHEAGAEGHRARQVPVRERRGQDGARRRLGAAHQARRRSAPASAPSRSATRSSSSATRRPSTTSPASSCASRATTRSWPRWPRRVAGYEVERVGMKLRLDGLAVEHAGGDAGRVRRGRGRGPRGRSRPAARPHERRRGGHRRGAQRRRRRRQAARPRRDGRQLAGDGRRRQEARLPAGHPRRGRRPRRARRTLRERPRRRRRGPRARSRHDRPRRRSGGVHAASPPGSQEGRPLPRLPHRRRRGRRLTGRRSSRGPRRPSPSTPASSSSTTSSLRSCTPCITLRQNIYTDPQKPIQVEPKLYEVGSAGPDSPVLITTNFSLTYFSVSGEVEGAGMPAWLLVADSDGQSVLTAWAAGKFDAEKIAKTVKDSGIESPHQPQEAGHPRARRRTVRRGRRGAARLADHGGPARRRGHPQLPQERLERVTRA